MITSRHSRQTMNALPVQLKQNLRDVFDMIDLNKDGFIKYDDLYDRWLAANKQSLNGLPGGFIKCLKQVTPANGMLTFERFCVALRLALTEDIQKMSPDSPKKPKRELIALKSTYHSLNDLEDQTESRRNPPASKPIVPPLPIESDSGLNAVEDRDSGFMSDSQVTTTGHRRPSSILTSPLFRMRSKSSRNVANRNVSIRPVSQPDLSKYETEIIMPSITAHRAQSAKVKTQHNYASNNVRQPSRSQMQSNGILSINHRENGYSNGMPARNAHVHQQPNYTPVRNGAVSDRPSIRTVPPTYDQVVLRNRSKSHHHLAQRPVSSIEPAVSQLNPSQSKSLSQIAHNPQQHPMNAVAHHPDHHHQNGRMINGHSQRPISTISNQRSHSSTPSPHSQISLPNQPTDGMYLRSSQRNAIDHRPQQNGGSGDFGRSNGYTNGNHIGPQATIPNGLVMPDMSNSRRHTVAESVPSENYISKRYCRFLDEERELIARGLNISQRLQNWYNQRLTTLDTKQKLIKKNAVSPMDFAINEEKLNYARAHITELNRRITSLIEASEKGFPSHAKFESSKNMPQPEDDQVQWMKRQNRLLTEEVSDKTARIAILESEKDALLRKLFDTGNVDSNQIYENGKIHATLM